MSEQFEGELYCRLSERQKEERRPEVEGLFRERMRGYRETEDGYRFRFEPGENTFRRIGAFVDAERRCCPFFRFQITVEPDDGPLSLEIGGSQRVKSFVAENMLPEVRAAAEG